MGAEQNLHRSIGKRQFCGFVGNFDTGLPQYAYPQLPPCASKKELFYAGGVMINTGGDNNEKGRTCTGAVHGHSLMLRL